MTRFDPTLIVERMRIERGNAPVFDERFHSGVNVIRGDNSSGKSTLLNFIFYGLGGDLSDWSTIAQLCSRVLIQVRINGNLATLARAVDTRSRQSMDMYPGGIEEALSAKADDWLRFGYMRSESRESFSQALYRLMNMPEVANDASGNLTMNQVLRLLYADQLTPVESLFKYQGTWDNGDIRDAVARLLFGAHSSRYYENEQEIRKLGKELDQTIGAYRSLLAVVGEAEDVFTHDWIRARRANLEQTAQAVANELAAAELAVGSAAHADAATLAAQEAAYAEVVTLQQEIGELRESRDNIAFKIADSDRFISALRHKLKALQDSSSVADAVGDIRFTECPACHAPMEDAPPPHACYLCKSPFDAGEERGRITAMINETALQISQSESLQRAREIEAAALEVRLTRTIAGWRAASNRLGELRRTPNTETQMRLRELNRRAGYVERELEELARKEALANRLEALAERRAEIERRISALTSENEALERQQASRLATASRAVEEEIKALLINDLRRQDIFEDPKVVAFDFRDNRISVNEETYFSASSRAILKSSFTLALLSAATKLSFMRHPRFCIIDTVENMGVEAVRSQNFQRQMLRISAESPVEHQIIFATAMIADELDEEAYTVGRAYTRDAPSLDIRT